MQVNIPKIISDPFHRYKREILKIKFTGGGNGKITKIENLPKVSKQLERTEEQISKWFSSDLNSPIVAQNGVYSLKGHFLQEQLEDSIEKFINDFILCKKCENPETVIGTNGGNIYLKCRCCGAAMETKSKNKVTEYILKDKKLRDKNLKEVKEVKEVIVKTTKTTETRNYDELKEFILKGGPSADLNFLRDKLRLTPTELTEKICYYILENNIFVSKISKDWCKYFEDYKNAKILLDMCLKRDLKRDDLVNLINTLYRLDYLDEDPILLWYDSLPSETDEDLQSKLKVVPFINWLENCSESE